MMKKLTVMTFAILFCCFMVLPVMAGSQGQQGADGQVQSTGHKQHGKDKPESEGRQLHKAHFKKLDDMKKRRDSAMDMRNDLINSDNPGNTGL